MQPKSLISIDKSNFLTAKSRIQVQVFAYYRLSASLVAKDKKFWAVENALNYAFEVVKAIGHKVRAFIDFFFCAKFTEFNILVFHLNLLFSLIVLSFLMFTVMPE